MAALPYMPLYVADYLADTAHLTTLEHGAYLMLIMNYWQRGKAIPSDDGRLARIARMPLDEWRQIRAVLAEFFMEEEGLWIHVRIEDDLRKVRDKSEKARTAGQRSAAARSNAAATPSDGGVGTASNVGSANAQRPLNHTDTDTDTKKKEPLANASGAAPKGRPELRESPVVAGKEQQPQRVDGGKNTNSPEPAPLPLPQTDYERALQELWDEGLASLAGMGVTEKTARRLVGLWLRDCDQDPTRVLGAINAARKRGIVDPVPWITAGFSKIKEKRTNADDRKTALVAAIGTPPQGDYGPEHFYVARDDAGNLDTGRNRPKNPGAYSRPSRK